MKYIEQRRLFFWVLYSIYEIFPWENSTSCMVHHSFKFLLGMQYKTGSGKNGTVWIPCQWFDEVKKILMPQIYFTFYGLFYDMKIPMINKEIEMQVTKFWHSFFQFFQCAFKVHSGKTFNLQSPFKVWPPGFCCSFPSSASPEHSPNALSSCRLAPLTLIKI